MRPSRRIAGSGKLISGPTAAADTLQTPGELVTHECWWTRNRFTFCGAYHPDESHVKVFDPATDRISIVAREAGGRRERPLRSLRAAWWHAAGSPDGRWIVADTFHGDVVLFNAKTTEEYPLTTGHRVFGKGGAHPHPGWAPSSDRVVFTSNRRGNPDLVIAYVPRAWIASVQMFPGALAAEPTSRPARLSIFERLQLRQLEQFDRDRAVLAARLKTIQVPYPFVRGNFHMHSELSHDSKGKLSEIIAAAKVTGTRIIGFTEHPSPTRDVVQNNVKGSRDGVYFLAGTESNNTLDGRVEKGKQICACGEPRGGSDFRSRQVCWNGNLQHPCRCA